VREELTKEKIQFRLRGKNITFNLSQSGTVDLRIYNILGQDVQPVIAGELSRGEYDVELDTRHFATGVYFLRFLFDGYQSVRKLMVVR
jgi:hypothetical protein